MTRTQIQFPEPLYQRLKEIAERQDESLSEVMRKAATSFRHIIDTRLTLSLRHLGVTHFATAKHFEGPGFERVWRPTVN